MKTNRIKIATGFVLLATVAFGFLIAATSTQTESYMLQWADANQTARPQFKSITSTSVVDTVSRIRGLGKDTTCAFIIGDFHTMLVEVNDTSASDSTAIRFDVYVGVKNQFRRSKEPIFGDFARVGMFTVTTDTAINIFGCTTPFGQTGYIVANGLAANKKASGNYTKSRIQMISQR